jgi:hypothetical protein
VYLLVVYVVLVIAGDILDYFIGVLVEAYWPAASLPVFLGLYFVFLWISWVLAVQITKPQQTTPQPAAA